MGRFVNGDGYADTGMDLTSSNMFAYCGNNPVTRADPTGEFWFAAIVLAGIMVSTALIFSGSSTVNQTASPTKAPHSSTSGAGSKHPSSQKPSPSDFNNSDGTYSLYDNHRGRGKKTNFHEQIATIKTSSPNFSLKNNAMSVGSVKATLMTGGWEWEHVDLSLLDVGSAKASLGYQDYNFNVSAMATLWDPSITFKFFGVNVSLTANIGSIGVDYSAGTNGFKSSAGFGLGAGISFSW